MLSPFDGERLLLQTFSSGQGACAKVVYFHRLVWGILGDPGGVRRGGTKFNSVEQQFESQIISKWLRQYWFVTGQKSPFSCIVSFVPLQLPIDLRGSVWRCAIVATPTHYIVHPPFVPNLPPPPFITTRWNVAYILCRQHFLFSNFWIMSN